MATGIVIRRDQTSETDLGLNVVTQAHVPMILETGTGSPPVAVAYVSFTRAYGTPPFMHVLHIGTYAGAGTMTVARLPRVDIVRVRSGSFQWRGTPLGRARWRAWGIGTRSPN